MSTTETETFALFGWCGSGDHHHERCRVTYVDTEGRERRCECPNDPERHGIDRPGR